MEKGRDSLAPLLMGLGLLALGLFHYHPLERPNSPLEQAHKSEAENAEKIEMREEPKDRLSSSTPSIWQAITLPPSPPPASSPISPKASSRQVKRAEVTKATVDQVSPPMQSARPTLQPEAARFSKAKADPRSRPALQPDRPPMAAEAPVPQIQNAEVSDEEPAYQISAKDHARGVALMNDFMAEEGASIQLSSPESARERKLLRQHLAHCYDRQLAINSEGRFWRIGDRAGAPWRFDPRRYSPMLRYLDGLALSDERQSVFEIRRHHAIRQGHAVVLVSLAFDRKLLGGLSSLIGGGVEKWGDVSGSFKLAGRSLFLERISVDGQPVSGRLSLGAIGRCG